MIQALARTTILLFIIDEDMNLLKTEIKRLLRPFEFAYADAIQMFIYEINLNYRIHLLIHQHKHDKSVFKRLFHRYYVSSKILFTAHYLTGFNSIHTF